MLWFNMKWCGIIWWNKIKSLSGIFKDEGLPLDFPVVGFSYQAPLSLWDMVEAVGEVAKIDAANKAGQRDMAISNWTPQECLLDLLGMCEYIHSRYGGICVRGCTRTIDLCACKHIHKQTRLQHYSIQITWIKMIYFSLFHMFSLYIHCTQLFASFYEVWRYTVWHA